MSETSATFPKRLLRRGSRLTAPWQELATRFVRPVDVLRYAAEVIGSGFRPRPSGSGLLQSAIHGGKDFRTHHRRPKGRSLPRGFLPYSDTSDTTIVIQGAIEHRSDFTAQTVRHYRVAFPDSPIVVSTWQDEEPAVLEGIADLGARIITSADPGNPGPSNFNRQVISTRAGVEEALSGGAKYVWKTRSDQRVYSPRAIELFRTLMMLFPPTDPGTAAGRIVVPSANTLRNRMYGASDQMQFGMGSDLLRLWSLELDPRGPDFTASAAPSGSRWEDLDLCETRINSRYIAGTGRNLRFSPEDSWRALVDLYCVVDSCMIDLFWPKYSLAEYRWRRYELPMDHEEVCFAEWLAGLGFGPDDKLTEFSDCVTRGRA